MLEAFQVGLLLLLEYLIARRGRLTSKFFEYLFD